MSIFWKNIRAFCFVLIATGCASVPSQPQTSAADATNEGFDGSGATTVPEDEPANRPTNETTPRTQLVFKRTVETQAALAEDPQLDFAVDEIELQFADAPAAEVARIILGKALGTQLAIAGVIDERISLQANDPVPAREAVKILEDALAAVDLLLVETDNGFLLQKRRDTANANALPSSAGLGFGIQSVSIQNTQPSQMLRLIEPFIADGVSLTANDAQALLFIEGTASDVSRVRDVVARFDTADLQNRVYGLFSPQFVDASTLQSEIEPLLGATIGETARLVELLPLPRLNQLFVLTRTQEQFRRVESWIKRLDQPSFGDEQRLYYYRVKNAPADILATQLETVFQTNGSGGGPIPGPNVTSGPNRNTASLIRRGSQQADLSIVADELNNALIVRGTGNQYREVLRLVEQMDVLAPQVLIEATIAEVTLTDDLRFGVRWFFSDGDSSTTFSDNPGGGVGPVFPGFSTTYFDGVDAGVAIDALSSITDVSILSAPSIMVQNNQTANLQVGDEVPIVVQQAVSVADQNAPIVSTVQLRETGVILEVKPRINSSDIVVLDVQQEVSEVASTTTSGIDSPTIQQRQFSSTVAVLDGGTVALGGLIRESQTSNESGIPGLRRIPVAGRLFSSTEINNRRTELIIFLRPSIVRTAADNDAVIQTLSEDLRSLETTIQNAASR